MRLVITLRGPGTDDERRYDRPVEAQVDLEVSSEMAWRVYMDALETLSTHRSVAEVLEA